LSEDRTIYSWGRNYRQFHICAKADSSSSGRQIASTVAVDLSHKYYPEELPFRLPEPIAQISVGNWHYVVLTSTGQVYTWGCNDCGQLGHYSKTDQNTPRPVKALSRRFIRSVAAGSEFTVCVDAEGQVLAWGRADGGQLGIDSNARRDSNPANVKKSALPILAPTLVPGLPPPSERFDDSGSIVNVRSNLRSCYSDIDADFPDFSSVGHKPEVYAKESVLVALQRLEGSYDSHKITQISCHFGQYYASSFCCELQQRWDKAFLYGIRLLKTINDNTRADEKSLKNSIINLAESILASIDNVVSDDVVMDNDETAIISFIFELFKACDDYMIQVGEIEECLLERKSFISPCLAIVLFREKIRLNFLPFPTQMVLSVKHVPDTIREQLSRRFLNALTCCISQQVYEGKHSYNFISNQHGDDDAMEDEANIGRSEMTTDLMSEKFDRELKQVIENKLKFQIHRSSIFLSSVTATTVSAPSSEIRGTAPWQQGIDDRYKNLPDSVVFTCNHNFPKYWMEGTILPEFTKRMKGLPKPLPETAQMLSHYYSQTGALIPAACPCCVFNNLRQEQLNLLQETGGELSMHKSTFWEV